MLLLTPLAPLPAKRVWILLNLTFLAAALCILRRLTELRWRHILLIAGLCFLPLRTNFMLGQYYVLILLLICLAYFAAFRGHRFTAGTLLATAAWFKVFPAVFVLLFVRKRDWRAVSGMIAGALALAAVSVLIFGLDMHRIWLYEVLPRAFRGDMVAPYDLQWSSFSSLWHRLFLFEPELNPAPHFRVRLRFTPWCNRIDEYGAALHFSVLDRSFHDNQNHSLGVGGIFAPSVAAFFHAQFLSLRCFDLHRDRWRKCDGQGGPLARSFASRVLYVIACAPFPTAGLFVCGVCWRRLLSLSSSCGTLPQSQTNVQERLFGHWLAWHLCLRPR